MNDKVTLHRLYELLTYYPETGLFIWNRNCKPAGSVDNKGYLRILLDGIRYKAHRLAWFYMKEVWPTNQIDHIDGNKLNNSFSNLRDVPQSINMLNKKKAHKNNKCGFLGVTQVGNKFYPRINIKGKLIHLGTFLTPEEAFEVYVKRKKSEISLP